MTSKTLTLTTAIVALPAAAFAQFNLGDTLPTAEADIRTMLEAQGYQIEEIELETDEIEVEATLDGVAYELTLAAATGEIIEIELDDEDGDDD
ncbi:PepSY domain-containing protein [uncultured Litoreibacter sp.]|nr:PepSY domain-containing protein [uncultured Litoreibacter sp.]